MKHLYEIKHNSGDEMCTVIFYVKPKLENNKQNLIIELPLCVKYNKTLSKDIAKRYSDWVALAIESNKIYYRAGETALTKERRNNG